MGERKLSEPEVNRRGFLSLTGAGSTLGALSLAEGIGGVARADGQPEAPGGHVETAHMRKYYATTRI